VGGSVEGALFPGVYGSGVPGGIGGNLCKLAAISLTVLMVGVRTQMLSIKFETAGRAATIGQSMIAEDRPDGQAIPACRIIRWR
jgi:hypothetical protein